MVHRPDSKYPVKICEMRHGWREPPRGGQGRSSGVPGGRQGPQGDPGESVAPVLSEEAIEAVRLVLAGRTVIDVDAGVEVTRSLPHGHVAAVVAQASTLGFSALLGPPRRERDLAFALRAGTCGRAGWRCSACRPRGWKAATASWRRSGIPVTAGGASRSSNTGCSQPGTAAQSRCGCSPATPAAPKPSSRPSRWSRTSSPSPGQSWSGIAG